MQYLVFAIDDTYYGVSVFNVVEVTAYSTPTAIPSPSPLILGIMSSRGKSISLVNIRHKFALPQKEIASTSKIVVLEICGNVMIGIVADSVYEVVTLNDEDMEVPPDMANSISQRFIQSIARFNDRFLLILDVDLIFSNKEIGAITKTSTSNIQEET